MGILRGQHPPQCHHPGSGNKALSIIIKKLLPKSLSLHNPHHGSLYSGSYWGTIMVHKAVFPGERPLDSHDDSHWSHRRIQSPTESDWGSVRMTGPKNKNSGSTGCLGKYTQQNIQWRVFFFYLKKSFTVDIQMLDLSFLYSKYLMMVMMSSGMVMVKHRPF